MTYEENDVCVYYLRRVARRLRGNLPMKCETMHESASWRLEKVFRSPVVHACYYESIIQNNALYLSKDKFMQAFLVTK